MLIRPSARGTQRALLALTLAALAVLAAGSAQAADDAGDRWHGCYWSKSQKRWITVRLTPPAQGREGELRFETLACSVGLKAAGAADAFVIGPYDTEPGAYCGGWLGGQLLLQATDTAARRAVEVTSASGGSRISFGAWRTPQRCPP